MLYSVIHTALRDSALGERMKHIKHLARKDSSGKREMEVCPVFYSDLSLFKAWPSPGI
jgi:hypothetical protein